MMKVATGSFGRLHLDAYLVGTRMWQRHGGRKEKGQLRLACSQHQMPSWTFSNLHRKREGTPDLRSDVLNVGGLKEKSSSVW